MRRYYRQGQCIGCCYCRCNVLVSDKAVSLWLWDDDEDEDLISGREERNVMRRRREGEEGRG